MNAQVHFDDEGLATQARTILAGADCGNLLVADGGPTICSETTVSVRDDGGEAVMTVPTAGTIWLTAPRPRWGSLVLKGAVDSGAGLAGVGLTLSGRLHRLGRHSVPDGAHSHCSAHHGGPELTQVALRVEEVWVSCPRLDSLPPAVSGVRQIPLLSYASAEPDLFAANSRRVTAHLNRFHSEQLRGWGAACAGKDVRDVAGASLTGLTRNGVRLWVVGRNGASGTYLEFPSPIQRFDELGELIGDTVRAARVSSNPPSAEPPSS
ncbi:hypothetical protein [Jatrophihabitans sp. GAS493]|uniref:hypothetical protein n=1 Tax=Jatrophihabitans sp. GAS493 TaxID=1907575 RepID=UPI0012FE7BE1|nr:hypothetical protein [Jatrophihabitans sp. GAS493]